MRFSQDFIEKVRDANDIVEIIGQYSELKGNGHRYMGRCPFPDHGDKTPSFSVSGDNQFYYCFGCKKGGNVFTFLEAFQGLSFPEAVEHLARRASLPLPEKEFTRSKNEPLREKKDLLLKINKLAGVFFHQQLKALPATHPARQYLVTRGLTEGTVEKFRLGVALDDWQGLVNNLKARRAPLDLAESLGLIKPKRNSRPEDSHFDLFRSRLMFPIFSATGDVIGFGGRTLEPDGLPKYLNSSESALFSKGRVFYGLHETGKFIRAEDAAIVVEGYMDAIALYTAGIKNVVAILGTAFTADHAKVLKRYTSNIVMLLDGDEAGLNGAERSLPILLEAGLLPKGFWLPNKSDPDDFVKAQGPDRLREEINRAPELFSLLLNHRWLVDYRGSPSEKVRVVEEAAAVLHRTQNRQLADLYILELSRAVDVDVNWVKKALASNSTPRPKSDHTLRVPLKEKPEENVSETAPEELPAERIQVKDAPKDEAFLASLLLHRENLWLEFVDSGFEETERILSHQGIRKVLRLALDRNREHPELFSTLAASLVSEVDSPDVLLSAVGLIGENPSEGLDRKLMTDYLNAIRMRFLKNRAKALAGQFKGQPSQETLEAFMEIQRDRLALRKEGQ